MIGQTIGAFLLVYLDETSGFCKGMITMGLFEKTHHLSQLSELQKKNFLHESKSLARQQFAFHRGVNLCIMGGALISFLFIVALLKVLSPYERH